MIENRVALCLWGTMRGPDSCLPTLYENIIKPWNTDVIVCINNHYDDDKDRVDKLRKLGANIIEESIKKQPDLKTTFPQSFYDKLIPLSLEKIKFHSNPWQFNYLGPLAGSHSGLYIRLNWYRLSYILEKYINNYDYFIITRPDHLYLFPLFDKAMLTGDDVIVYNAHDFQGVNADFAIVSRKITIDWLRKSVDYLCNEKLQNDLIVELNQSEFNWCSEVYTAIVVRLCGWKLKKMSINSFVSADSLDELTSCHAIQYDKNHQYFFKHETSYQPCKNNFELWQNNHRWINSDNGIFLG